MHHAYIDKFAYQDSPLHRIDGRVKLIAALVYTAIVISLPRYSIGILSWYAVGPVAVLIIGGIPVRYAIKYIVLCSPVILVFALSCVFYDKRQANIAFGSLHWSISYGWLRCFNILAKFTVTMLTLIGLVSTTRFSELLSGMSRLGVPRVLTTQLGFLYRYIFLLIDKAHRVLRARASRKLCYLGLNNEVKTAASMIGSMLVSSLKSAETISMAMEARGFNGSIRTLSRMRIRGIDYIFICAAIGYIVFVHIFIRPLFGI